MLKFLIIYYRFFEVVVKNRTWGALDGRWWRALGPQVDLWLPYISGSLSRWCRRVVNNFVSQSSWATLTLHPIEVTLWWNWGPWRLPQNISGPLQYLRATWKPVFWLYSTSFKDGRLRVLLSAQRGWDVQRCTDGWMGNRRPVIRLLWSWSSPPLQMIRSTPRIPKVCLLRHLILVDRSPHME